MKCRRKLAAVGLVVVAFVICLRAEPIAELSPSNYVNDFAGVLDPTTAATLNDLCRQVEEKAHAQITVVTVKSTDGQDVVSYAVALYQKWGVGKKGQDRGVLILLATQDRKYWTTVGYGLEPILPDGKVGGFGREAVPLLRSGDYAGAVSLMTSRVANVIATDAGVTLVQELPPQRVRGRRQSPGIGLAGVAILLLVFLFLAWVSRRGGRGGGGSGLLSGILWGLLFSSMRGGGRGGYSGGSFGGGGFGGGGGGFGGFGGGSTGGGGAGGSW